MLSSSALDNSQLLQQMQEIPQDVIRIFHDTEILAHQLVYNQELLALAKKTILDANIRTLTTTRPFARSHIFKNNSSYNIYAPSIPLHPGLIVYFLCPNKRKDNHMYVVFRGTKCINSVTRDTEDGAPGHLSFKASEAAVLTEFNKILEFFAFPHEKINVTICGHSLGASDAQNFCAALLENLKQVHNLDEMIHHQELPYFKKISRVRMVGFNSAGITKKIAESANEYALFLRAKKLVKLECYWLHAAGDAVQQTGQANLFSQLPHEIVNIHLLKVTCAAINENTWNYYNPLQLYHTARNTLLAHTSKHFHAENKNIWQYNYFTNSIPEQAVVIASKLAKKSGFLQSSLAITVQSVLRSMLEYGFNSVSGIIYKPNGTLHFEHDVFVYNILRSSNDRINIEVMQLRSYLSLLRNTPRHLAITLSLPQLENYLFPALTDVSVITASLNRNGDILTHYNSMPLHIISLGNALTLQQPSVQVDLSLLQRPQVRVTVQPISVVATRPPLIEDAVRNKMLAEMETYIKLAGSRIYKNITTQKKLTLAKKLKNVLSQPCEVGLFNTLLRNAHAENLLLEKHKSNPFGRNGIFSHHLANLRLCYNELSNQERSYDLGRQSQRR